MRRRGLLIAAGGALAARAATANAQIIDPVARYLDRLQLDLADAGGGGFLSAVETQLLAEHDSLRHVHGLNGLLRNPALDAAARAHVADLLRRDYFEHRSPEGFTSEHRVGLLARRFVGAAGENIALQEGGNSRPSAADFMKLWRESPGHLANMLRAEYTDVGFGVVAKGDRTIAGAVFGRTYAELRTPAPFHIGRGDGLAGVLDGAAPALSGYDLQAVQGGERIGPFRGEAAPHGLHPGAYAIRPRAPDPNVPYRYWVLFGPIVLAG